jgi:pimeloyl-ACP methyl ester carboxylesterase
MIRWSLQTIFYNPEAVTRDLEDEVYQLAKKPRVGHAWMSWQKNEIRWGGLHTNFVDELHTLAVPTLILHGAEDRYVPVSWAQRAHTLIKDSELHIFPQCGHWLTREKPQEFNRAVLEFLASE